MHRLKQNTLGQSVYITISLANLDSIHCILRAHQERQQMDRRRFEAAHLKYASLQMAARYPAVFSSTSIKVESCISDTLKEITPALFKAFETRYAGLVLPSGKQAYILTFCAPLLCE